MGELNDGEVFGTIPTSSDHRAVERFVIDTWVVFANLGNADHERVRADLDELVHPDPDDDAASAATVLLLCEASDRWLKVLRPFLADNPKWQSYAAWQTPGGPAVPILWDTRVWSWVRSRGVVAGDPGEWVGPKGAGPTHAKGKVVTEAVLLHRATGLEVKFLDTHPIPSITRNKLPRKERRARRRHYRRHMRVLARVVRKTRVRVVLGIDAQAAGDSRWLRPLRRAGLEGWTTTPTAHGEPIDHLVVRERVGRG